MASISYDPRLDHLQTGGAETNHRSVLTDKIEGLIRVYKDGHIERPSIVAAVPCTTVDGVTAKDVVIDSFSKLWARIYVPMVSFHRKLPLLVYFHGGGFCVGSAAWSCYDQFLHKLASRAGCVILSVNYRLAPENRLPAAYDDGFNTLMWLKQQTTSGSSEHVWLSSCNFSSLFLGGDSAGANIAYNVATRLFSNGTQVSLLKPFSLKGTILIQPFFGGEIRSSSETKMVQPANSALTLSASDTYWRLSLPLGANRDHPFCNPLTNGAMNKLRYSEFPPVMVCISEMDILKDRNLEFCNVLAHSAGKRVEMVIHKGVGHAFQVLHNSPLSQTRLQEMMSQLNTFINQ